MRPAPFAAGPVAVVLAILVLKHGGRLPDGHRRPRQQAQRVRLLDGVGEIGGCGAAWDCVGQCGFTWL